MRQSTVSSLFTIAPLCRQAAWARELFSALADSQKTFCPGRAFRQPVGKETPLAVWKQTMEGSENRRKDPLYDNLNFHRVLSGVMIQSADPTGTASHNCGITIPDESLPGLKFYRAGRLAVANTGAPDSGGCQFFITTDIMPQWSGSIRFSETGSPDWRWRTGSATRGCGATGRWNRRS
jgi:cyclophilin family peptidyl-prolyl cis-trans isomerase